MKSKNEEVGELWFSEKDAALHQKTKTGLNSSKWRNLEQAIEENLKKHFKNDQN
ncbi:hypothetical protein [uncultured Mediterranean phage uvMED]|nr:hypothetical protein [uncultured Mediterranean phage uvMED]